MTPARIPLVALALSLAPLVACDDADAPGPYRDALEHVVTAVDTVHRATLDGRSPALAAAVATAWAEIDDADTEAEFELVVARMLVPLGDGHSSIGPTTTAAIDLPMLWLADGPVVAIDTDVLRAGDAIVAIGGRSAATILADLAAHVSRDNDGWLRDVAPRWVPRRDWLAAMDMLDGDLARVEIERDGAHRTFELPLVDGRVVDPWPAREVVGYALEPEHDLGVFHLDACTYDAHYQDTLDAFMAEVRAHALGKIAIDLRRNRGGDVTVAYALLAYLTDDYDSFSVSARKSDALREQAPIYADPGFLGLLSAFDVALDGPTFEIPGAALTAGLGARVPAVAPEDRFTGDVYVLVSPTTYSSAQLFVEELVDNGLGTSVGDQTGANRNSTGDELVIEIPDTALELTLAASFTAPPDAAAGRGPTLADLVVPLTRADVQAGRDPVLDAVRERVSR